MDLSEKEILKLLKTGVFQLAHNSELFEWLVEYFIRTEDEDIIYLFPPSSIMGPISEAKFYCDIAYRFPCVIKKFNATYHLSNLMTQLIISDEWEHKRYDWVESIFNYASRWTSREKFEFIVYVMDRVSYKFKRVVLDYPDIWTDLGDRLVEFKEDYLYLYEKYNHTNIDVPSWIIDALFEPGVGELWKRQVKKMEEYEELVA